MSRHRVFEIVAAAKSGDRTSAVFDIFIVSLILANIAVFIVESVEPIRALAPGFFFWFEACSVAVFTVEYLLRLWTCVENPRFKASVRGRVRHAMTPLALIDLLAIVPFYLPFLGVDLRVFRAFRIFRIARIAKLGRYSRAVRIIGVVLVEKKEEIVTTVGLILVLLLISSTLMYFVEREAQPDLFGNIPQAMWWGVATLTTVGYGDAYPITPLGQLLGAGVSILGIGMFALPTGILGAGFVEELQRLKSQANRKCPHCGEELPR